MSGEGFLVERAGTGVQHTPEQPVRWHEYADIFPWIEGQAFDDLVEDIRKNGVLEPIVFHEGAILDGRNRYMAARELGIEYPYVEYEGDDPLGYVISHNLKRRHLTESQRAMVAGKLAKLPQGARTDLEHRANLHEVSAAEAGRMLNVSERTVKSAKQVQEHGAPELVQAVETGKASVSSAADVASLPKEEQAEIVAKGEDEIKRAAAKLREQRAEENARKRAEIAAQKAVIPAGKFGTIIIDPPWPMQKIDRDVRPNQVGFDYPTMTESELVSFGEKVNDCAADHCHMFMWTTQKFLPMALRILDAWGFRYLLTMVWHKSGGFQPIGLPQYNCEFAIYARKGSPVFIDTKAFNCCFEAPRREHSRKPDEFYDLVRRVTGEGRIDIFSREPRDGFAQLGNEADKFGEAA